MMMMMSLLLRFLVLPLAATTLCDAFSIIRRIPSPSSLAPPATTLATTSSRILPRQMPVLSTSRSTTKKKTKTSFIVLHQSSFAADGSEYSSNDSSFDNDNNDDDDLSTTATNTDYEKSYLDYDQDETPTVELTPVPMSKNSGNRFVAFVWDRELMKTKKQKKAKTNDTENLDGLDLHYNRIALTEQHVMYCRKANLYNETFNTESMVDVLWSLPM